MAARASTTHVVLPDCGERRDSLELGVWSFYPIHAVSPEMSPPPVIVGIGETLWDVFPDESRFGGAPANFAAHCAALGAEAAMVSAVGEDDLGRRAIGELAARRVNADNVARSARPTGTVRVSLDDAGKADYVFAADTAWDRLDWTDELAALAARADAVCFGSLGQRSPRSCQTIRRFVGSTPLETLRIFDVNLRQHFYNDDTLDDSLFLANILKLNDEEIDVVDPGGAGLEPVARLQGLREKHELELIALTRGDKGALLVGEGGVSDSQGIAAEVKDTVGAGDAFTAVLAHGLLRGVPLDEINRRAGEVAAYVCSQNGATPELPEELRGPFGT